MLYKNQLLQLFNDETYHSWSNFSFLNKQAPYIEGSSYGTSQTLDGFHIQLKTYLFAEQPGILI